MQRKKKNSGVYKDYPIAGIYKEGTTAILPRVPAEPETQPEASVESKNDSPTDVNSETEDIP